MLSRCFVSRRLSFLPSLRLELSKSICCHTRCSPIPVQDERRENIEARTLVTDEERRPMRRAVTASRTNTPSRTQKIAAVCVSFRRTLTTDVEMNSGSFFCASTSVRKHHVENHLVGWLFTAGKLTIHDVSFDVRHRDGFDVHTTIEMISLDGAFFLLTFTTPVTLKGDLLILEGG